MVAVRSAGLAFESIIGVVRDQSTEMSGPDGEGGGSGQEHDDEVIEALVDEEYLRMLLAIANERFEANTERMKRFEKALFRDESPKEGSEWEGKEERKGRKRREGLMRSEVLKADSDTRNSGEDPLEESIGLGELEDIT